MPRKPKKTALPAQISTPVPPTSPFNVDLSGSWGGHWKWHQQQLLAQSTHFIDSFNRKRNPTANELINVSKTIPFSRAIELISNGVVNMKWTVKTPENSNYEKDAIAIAKSLTQALQRPNGDGKNSSYRELVKAMVRDALIFGSIALEKQPALYPDSQPFWLWNIDIPSIRLVPEWNASVEGITPRIWYTRRSNSPSEWIPIYSENLVLFSTCNSSFDLVPDSPVKIAYEEILAWLGLRDYKTRIIERAVRNFMISVEDATEEDLIRIREYWRSRVQGEGEIPIIGGKVNVISYGATNDEELYPKHTEFILILIALAFGLSRRDFNLTETDNRATAGVAADATFQNAVLPLAQLIIDKLNWEVIDFYAPGYSLELADTEPRNEGEEAKTAVELYKGGLITKNEGRLRVGHSELPDGDTFIEGGKASNEVGSRLFGSRNSEAGSNG